jgi:hypothetical protein
MHNPVHPIVLLCCIATFFGGPSHSLAASKQPLAGTATITDTKGKKYRVRDFEFTDNGLKVDINVPALSFGSTTNTASTQRIIPLESVRSLTFEPQENRAYMRKTHIITTDATQAVFCGYVHLKGKQDLGELGTGDFSIGIAEMKTIEFEWPANAKKRGEALGTGGRSGDWFKGSVSAEGAKHSFQQMTFYYQTSGSQCPIHSYCTGCTLRNFWTTGNTTAELDTVKDKTQLKIPLQKVKSMTFGAGSDVALVLRSGTEVDVERRSKGQNEGILSRDTQGWTYVPLKLIQKVEIE